MYLFYFDKNNKTTKNLKLEQKYKQTSEDL